ncbi:MAG: alpha/beta fold hydrolase [Paracoccaceae bacterium]
MQHTDGPRNGYRAAGDIPQPLAHRIIGDGPRQVLALHCTIGFSGVWRGLAEQFPDCTFVAPDMLSHGASPDWDREGDFQDRMMEGVLPFLNGRMDVIGHSFGGLLALRIAAEFPEQVRSLTVVEPVFFAIAAEDAPEVLAEERRMSKPVFDAFEAGDEPLAARRFNRIWGDADGPRWPDLPERTRQAMVRGIHVVNASGPAVMDRVGLLQNDRLAVVDMPALMLRGAQCEPIVPVINDGLARRLKHAENVAIQGAGHMVPITHPVETATHLRALFDRAQ